jgi:hypothetical protein
MWPSISWFQSFILNSRFVFRIYVQSLCFTDVLFGKKAKFIKIDEKKWLSHFSCFLELYFNCFSAGISGVGTFALFGPWFQLTHAKYVRCTSVRIWCTSVRICSLLFTNFIIYIKIWHKLFRPLEWDSSRHVANYGLSTCTGKLYVLIYVKILVLIC